MARAAPLTANDRRAAIMEATERLIVAQGGAVSTREIAEAAGIAQGTIFRVFPTKEAIIDAIFADAFDRDAIRTELAGLRPADPLEAKMRRIVAVLQGRNRRIVALFTALGARRPPAIGDRKNHLFRWELSLAEIGALLEPDRDALRMSPLEAARLMQSLVIALRAPMLAERPEYSAEAIVDLILNGIARRDAGQADLESPSC
jgi:AcrR family transcriptional regulator